MTALEDTSCLRDQWTALRATEPGIRARDAAAKLGVAEGQLVAAVVGAGATRLRGPFHNLIEKLPTIGRVMVLTRNDAVVHERKGVFGNVKTTGHVGIVLNETIDLRLFLQHWPHGFVVEEEVRSGRRTSLQFFDRSGTAVHKIYLLPESDLRAFHILVEEFRDTEQTPDMVVRPYPAKRLATQDEQIDIASFRSDWEAMKDVHEFHGILRSHGLDRLQALRHADSRFVSEIRLDSLHSVLAESASRTVPIMAFVGNRGCIQIHTGPVANIRPMENWENVLDPDFNLHVRTDALATAFVVRKPTDDGIVTALEFFDRNDDHVLQLFGARKPGKPELTEWRELVAELEAAQALDKVA